MAVVNLLIASVPTDAHGQSNCIYFNPADGVRPRHVCINGMLFDAKPDAQIAAGTLAMNLIQRRCSRVTTTAADTVAVPVEGHAAPAGASLVTLELTVEYVAASKKGGELDYQAFMDIVTRSFAGQYFQLGQALLVVVGSAKYVASVTAAEGVGTGGGPAPVAALAPETAVTLKTLERCEMTMTNVPDAVQDAQQPRLIGSFDLEKLGIGGLRAEFGEVFRSAFASRIFPQSLVKKLRMPHCKGLLLFGPPGTGKTLIARKIGDILNCKPPKIVNGPEVFSKYVGQAEENVRKLFADAEADQSSMGDKSPLHLIIFDEFDAICKQRGASRDGTGVGDNVVNQLLSKIDGVNQLNNVLLIGMTNRKDLIDEAILRPGRFETHVEIGLPDEQGRQQILRIHTAGMRDCDVLHESVDYAAIAAATKNFSGAEIEGLVRAAQSFAFERHIDFDDPTHAIDPEKVKVTMDDFEKALTKVKPAFGRDDEDCAAALRNGIIDFGAAWQLTQGRLDALTSPMKASSQIDMTSLLITGATGTGKSAVAAHVAMRTEFPYVKLISSNSMVGYGELQKANLIRKAFDDAFKTRQAVIILDDVERIVEYSALGGRYSNTLLQTLLVLVKRRPPPGKQVFVVATAQSRDVMDALEVTDALQDHVSLPLVDAAGVPLVAEGLGVEWASPADRTQVAAAVSQPLPVQRLILLVERASELHTDGRRVLAASRFLEAVATSM